MAPRPAWHPPLTLCCCPVPTPGHHNAHNGLSNNPDLVPVATQHTQDEGIATPLLPAPRAIMNSAVPLTSQKGLRRPTAACGPACTWRSARAIAATEARGRQAHSRPLRPRRRTCMKHALARGTAGGRQAHSSRPACIVHRCAPCVLRSSHCCPLSVQSGGTETNVDN